MYQLSVIKDTVPIHPTSFHLPTEKALLNQLNKKYADRVIPDVGLGISVFDILEASEGKVRYGDGCFWHKVTFRLIVFRPFVSEVVAATVTGCSEKFIHVSTGFFHDISIPLSLVPAPHAYDPNENAHFTLSGADPDMTEEEMLETDVTQRLYIDKGEAVRIRVEEDKFHDDEPGPPRAVDGTYIKPKMQRPHYEIIASMSGAGLGCVAWWSGQANPDAAPS